MSPRQAECPTGNCRLHKVKFLSGSWLTLRSRFGTSPLESDFTTTCWLWLRAAATVSRARSDESLSELGAVALPPLGDLCRQSEPRRPNHVNIQGRIDNAVCAACPQLQKWAASHRSLCRHNRSAADTVVIVQVLMLKDLRSATSHWCSARLVVISLGD